MLYFGKTNFADLVFSWNDFLRLVGAPNESLILIIIYYMFKYSIGIKTTFLESLRSQKIILQAIFRQNYFCWLSFWAKSLFKACWSTKWVANTYYNVLYVQIPSWDQNKFVIVASEPKKYFEGYISEKTSYNDLVLALNEFLRLVGAPNESLILIIIYYMFKYSVGI